MTHVEKPLHLLEPAVIPEKKLFGPGPSNMRSQVRDAMAQPLLGHLHTEFLKARCQSTL